jgi:SAM-dependent methyltransferase
MEIGSVADGIAADGCFFGSASRAVTDQGAEQLEVAVPQLTNQDLSALLADLLRPTDDMSRPNLNVLRVALRDIEALKLNVKYLGYELAKRLRETAPPRIVTSPPEVQLRSKASTQADIESDWVAYWAAQTKIGVVYHRKLWEMCYVLHAIHQHGHMTPHAKGLGFGCGEEPLPSYLAARGVAVTMTDLPPEDARAEIWAGAGQHAVGLERAFKPDLVDRDSFDRNVTLRYVDMTSIPNDLKDYDFCWSICALEHLGSIAQGLDFIENSLKTLRPGGLAIHTTEFNCFNDRETIDNWPSCVLFQRRHFLEIAERLGAEGHYVAELDFDVGNQILDKFIDVPPYLHELSDPLRGTLPSSLHMKLVIDGFVITCFGLIIRKAEEIR